MYMNELDSYFNDFSEMTKSELVRITTLFNVIPTPCCILEGDNNILFSNKAMLDLFNLEVINSITDISPNYQPDGVLSEIKANTLIDMVSHDGKVTFEWMYMNSCGVSMPARVTLVRVDFINGSLILGFSSDLREVSLLEQELRRTNNRMRTIYDSIPLACTFFDSEFNLIDCNDTAVELFGLSNRMEYVERFYELSPFYQPCGESSELKATRLLMNTLKNGKSSFPWLHQKLDGELIPMDITLIPVEIDRETLIIGYAHDLRDLDVMSQLANCDVLTGLYNRRYCYDILSFLLGNETNFNVCFIDIDKLKHVNDSLGHSEGDDYIKFVVSKILNRIRKSDILCRVGGDEFVLILFNNNNEQSEYILSNICLNIEEGNFPYFTSISYGIVCSNIKHTVDSIMHEADTLMYEHKVRKKRNLSKDM